MSIRGRCVVVSLALLVLFALIGCARESGSVTCPPSLETPADQADLGRAAASLRLELPPLIDAAAGDEITCSVRAELAGVYQGSFRLHYDPSCLQALSAEAGGLLPRDCLFLSSENAQGSAYSCARLSGRLGATAPCAFSIRPGSDNVIDGAGELLKVRFRLLKPPPAWDAAIVLDPRPAYLQFFGRRAQASCSLLPIEEVRQ